MAKNKFKKSYDKTADGKFGTKGSRKPKYKGKDKYGDKIYGGKSEGGASTVEALGTNDPDFYKRNPVQFSLATAISFPYNAATPYPTTDSFDTVSDADLIHHERYYSPSYGMRIHYVPGVGVATNANDAPNMAFRKMFAAMQSKTFSKLAFRPASLGVFVTVTQSVAQNIALLKRVLSLSNMYNSFNKAYPDGMIKMAGFDPDSITLDRSETAWRINKLIYRLNNIEVPDYIYTFKRHRAMAENVYLDNVDVKAQVYMYQPDVYYLLADAGIVEEGVANGKSTAIPIPFKWYSDSSALYTLNEFCDLVEAQLNAIENSSDADTIRGYLKTAFDASVFMKTEAILPTHFKPSVRDDYILNAIANMTIVGKPEGAAVMLPDPANPEELIEVNTLEPCNHIKVDYVKDLIIYEPAVRPVELSGGAHIIPWCNPRRYLINYFDPAFVKSDDAMIETTRTMTILSRRTNDSGSVFVDACGTEFITEAVMFAANRDAFGRVEISRRTFEQFPSVYSETTDEEGAFDLYQMRGVAEVSKFHLGPRMYPIAVHYDPTRGTTDFTALPYIGDVNHWTYISADDLRGQHDVALLSVYGVDSPVEAKTAR